VRLIIPGICEWHIHHCDRWLYTFYERRSYLPSMKLDTFVELALINFTLISKNLNSKFFFVCDLFSAQNKHSTNLNILRQEVSFSTEFVQFSIQDVVTIKMLKIISNQRRHTLIYVVAKIASAKHPALILKYRV